MSPRAEFAGRDGSLEMKVPTLLTILTSKLQSVLSDQQVAETLI